MRSYVSFFVLLAFFANTIGTLPQAQADEFRLPAPGVRVGLSPEFNPPILKGLKVHPDNPFRFDFILDQGNSLPLVGRVREGDLKQEATKLIKYFLASLTIPEGDLWVNLSPYEKNRIIPQSFGLTEMGRDLLAEDYMLKQITASLIYPEDAIGKKFWKRIYQEAFKKFGTTNIPVNTFNKVWIVPEKAVVYENVKAGTAYVVEAKLKVMLEQDYLSLSRHSERSEESPSTVNALGSQIVREIVLPELTREVNEGKNFSQLRQVYNSLILATWYKKKIKDSILEQVYADKKKTAGVQYVSTVIPANVGLTDTHSCSAGIHFRNDIEAIYQRYLQAFKKGVYNYIKEDVDPSTQETIPIKYFSGGMFLGMTRFDSDSAMHITDEEPKELGNSREMIVKMQADPAKSLNRSLFPMPGERKKKKRSGGTDQLRELLAKQGPKVDLTQGQLAEDTGASKSSVSRILNEETNQSSRGNPELEKTKEFRAWVERQVGPKLDYTYEELQLISGGLSYGTIAKVLEGSGKDSKGQSDQVAKGMLEYAIAHKGQQVDDPPEQLAIEHGIGIKTVYKYWRNYGITRRKKSKKSPQTDEAMMSGQGRSRDDFKINDHDPFKIIEGKDEDHFTVEVSGQKFEVEISNEIPGKEIFYFRTSSGVPSSIYTRTGGDSHGIGGIDVPARISRRGMGNLMIRVLLSRYPQAYLDPNTRNVILMKELIQKFGFKPSPGAMPNAYYLNGKAYITNENMDRFLKYRNPDIVDQYVVTDNLGAIMHDPQVVLLYLGQTLYRERAMEAEKVRMGDKFNVIEQDRDRFTVEVGGQRLKLRVIPDYRFGGETLQFIVPSVISRTGKDSFIYTWKSKNGRGIGGIYVIPEMRREGMADLMIRVLLTMYPDISYLDAGTRNAILMEKLIQKFGFKPPPGAVSNAYYLDGKTYISQVTYDRFIRVLELEPSKRDIIAQYTIKNDLEEIINAPGVIKLYLGQTLFRNRAMTAVESPKDIPGDLITRLGKVLKQEFPLKALSYGPRKNVGVLLLQSVMRNGSPSAEGKSANRAMTAEQIQLREEIFGNGPLSDQAKHEIRALFPVSMLRKAGWIFDNVDKIPVEVREVPIKKDEGNNGPVDQEFILVKDKDFIQVFVNTSRGEFFCSLENHKERLRVSSGKIGDFSVPEGDEDFKNIPDGKGKRFLWWLDNRVQYFARSLGFQEITFILVTDIAQANLKMLGYEQKGEKYHWFKPVNKAVITPTGGIDLTPARMNLQTKVDSRFRGNDTLGGRDDNREGIKFHIDPAMLAQLQNAPGFVPVIIDIEPLKDLKSFLEANVLDSELLRVSGMRTR